MNSPEASPTPAAMMPGPIRGKYFLGSAGISRTSGLPTLCVGKTSATAVLVAAGVPASSD